MNTMNCQGYLARIDFDPEIGSFHGRVLNLNDVVNFYGKSVADLKREFEKSLDVYLEVCKENGRDPDKPYSGTFNVRVSPEDHRAISGAAVIAGTSMNRWVSETLAKEARKAARES